ncbi:trehalose synthase, partial [Microbacterium testaceum]
AVGADLSYDFVTRPGYHHALATANTEFLRLALTTSLEIGVEPAQLVHGMQNHDELTYELVHWATTHHDTVYPFRHGEATGAEIAETVRAELTEKLTVDADYNLVFTQNGIACTTASLIAATQGRSTLAEITAEDIPAIRDAHLLLAKYNSWQPGVFALSGWDLTGSLTLPVDDVRHLIASGDTRWIERGAHDLLDVAPDASGSASGMPRARSLYGSLTTQQTDASSFLSGLRDVLKIRTENGIAVASQVDIPQVGHPSMLVMVHRLDGGDRRREDAPLQITVLNFSGETIEGTVRSEWLAPQSTAVDAATGDVVGRVDELQSFALELAPYAGLFLLMEDAPAD